MKMFSGKTSFARRFKTPLLFTRGCVHCIEIAVIAGKKNHTTIYRWRRGYSAVSREFPLQASTLQINGVEIAIATSRVHYTPSNGRRRKHAPISVEFPFDLIELRYTHSLINAGVLRIATKHNRVLAYTGQTKKQQIKCAKDFHAPLDVAVVNSLCTKRRDNDRQRSTPK